MSLSIGQKAGWGLADMGIVVFVIVKQLLILAFMNSFLGIPIAIAGAVTTAVLVFDIISDPIIGYFSDKTVSRFGRRAPWMLIGSVVLALAMIGLFAVPESFNINASLIWVIIFFLISTLGFTMVSIPYGAMAGEMTLDKKERSSMTAWRMAFASLGILIGGALIPILAGDTRSGYTFATICIAPLIILSIWFSVFFTRKTPRTLVPSQQNFSYILRLVLSNRAFITLVILYGIMTLAIALITAGLPFAAMYLILDDGNSLLSGVAKGLGTLSLMFAAFVLGSIISQAMWVRLSNLYGKVAAQIIGIVCYIALLIFIFFSLPNYNVTLIAGLFILAGMTNGSYQQIPWALYPDLMDVTREETGESIEGAFSAVWLFGQKVANAISPLVLGFILSMYGWKETTEGITKQSDAALDTLQTSITLIPAAILGIAGILLVSIYLPQHRKLMSQNF
ncbi:MAG: MFS transporter [Paracoccaceae bacterium]|mgnify:FL=1|jgi:GPH family glycoside/pentoside/hexuronide:cation symporter|nr:MFS transporter [Paracoccaceae bacterium]|tara:strand:+ start:1121 stop:2473 length:1353 start_codon:yes stop_codon:yes gene_type:complete